LILYSRVYQEAKKQGEKLENEKRRLYEIDYQIASQQIRQQQSHSNGHSTKNDTSSIPLNHENNPDEECNLDPTMIDGIQLKKDYSDPKVSINRINC
jgi:hypothetical protein